MAQPAPSLLDLVPVDPARGTGAALADAVEFARAAEEAGYARVWYAEHHNMPAIGSSATAVLCAHVAARTSTITVGAGGVMLPNHAPLVVAEQFGTLAELHPGRIELGLGRAPGTDRATSRALRRDDHAAQTFPDDVAELRAYLAGSPLVPGVQAVPGTGTRVPLYLLGSSLFGARLAARLGLPYAFASHFAPDDLHEAVAAYRAGFTPSPDLERPRVLAAVNVVLGDTTAEAVAERRAVLVQRVAFFLGRAGTPLPTDRAEALLAQGHAAQIEHMLRHTAVGTAAEVAEQLDAFRRGADADELVLVHQGRTPEFRVRSLRRTAEALAV